MNFSADAFRLYLFSHHYRTAWEYIDAEIEEWEDVARELQEAAETLSAQYGEQLDTSVFEDTFFGALDNDLDTPAAIAELRRLSGEILASEDIDFTRAQRLLIRCSAILGLTLSN